MNAVVECDRVDGGKLNDLISEDGTASREGESTLHPIQVLACLGGLKRKRYDKGEPSGWGQAQTRSQS